MQASEPVPAPRGKRPDDPIGGEITIGRFSSRPLDTDANRVRKQPENERGLASARYQAFPVIRDLLGWPRQLRAKLSAAIRDLRDRPRRVRAKLSAAIRDLRDRPRRARNRRIRHTAGIASRTVRQRLRTFAELKTISPETRRTLMPKMVRYESRLALFNAREELIHAAIRPPFTTIFFVAFFITPYAISVWHQTWPGWFSFVLVLYASVFAWFLILLTLVLPMFIFAFFNMGRAAAFLSLFWGVLGVLACVCAFYKVQSIAVPLPFSYLVVLFALSETLVCVGSMLIYLLFIVLPMRYVISVLVAKRIPDALLVDRLLLALETASLPEQPWGELRTKNRLMRQLEEAARIVDDRMPTALRPFDLYTASWQRNRFGEIAASLRAKKQWVCMPKPDTRDRLQESLSRFFVDAAFGRWDSLETAERSTKKRAVFLRARSLVQSIVVAVLPAAVFIGAKRLGFSAGGQLETYLNIAVLLWLVLGILFVIDPRIAEKIEVAQKFTSLVPGLSKKKEV